MMKHVAVWQISTSLEDKRRFLYSVYWQWKCKLVPNVQYLGTFDFCVQLDIVGQTWDEKAKIKYTV